MTEGLVVRRKRFGLPFALGLLAGVAFGFAAGLAYLTFHRSVTAGALEDWHYPGATSTSTSGAGVGSPFGPPLMTRGSMQMTTDSFDDVTAHYAKKMGVNSNLQSGSTSGSRASGSESVTYHVDNHGPTRGPRPMKSQAFARRERGGSVVVFITRADGEDHTHVLLYWLPRQ
jgi:hypothetical protein